MPLFGLTQIVNAIAEVDSLTEEERDGLHRKLRTWTQTGVISPDVPGLGRGSESKYSLETACKIRTLIPLVVANLDGPTVKRIFSGGRTVPTLPPGSHIEFSFDGALADAVAKSDRNWVLRISIHHDRLEHRFGLLPDWEVLGSKKLLEPFDWNTDRSDTATIGTSVQGMILLPFTALVAPFLTAIEA